MVKEKCLYFVPWELAIGLNNDYFCYYQGDSGRRGFRGRRGVQVSVCYFEQSLIGFLNEEIVRYLIYEILTTLNLANLVTDF